MVKDGENFVTPAHNQYWVVAVIHHITGHARHKSAHAAADRILLLLSRACTIKLVKVSTVTVSFYFN